MDMMSRVKVEEPRQPGKVKFPLLPTLFGIVIAWICGYNSAVHVAEFLNAKKRYLNSLMPSYPVVDISNDTVLRLLKIIKFENLEEFLFELCERLACFEERRHLALDGQTDRAMVYDTVEENQKNSKDRRLYNRVYYVTLFDSTNGVTMGMEEVNDKENENKACERLLDLMTLRGCVVTADALNTRRAIAKKIIEQEGDYCLAVKENNKALAKHIRAEFLQRDLTSDPLVQSFETDIELAHGRIEKRTVHALPAALLKKAGLKEWAYDAETIFMAVTESSQKKYNCEQESEIRFYISSLVFEEGIAKAGYRAIRDHWGIENKLHYVMDVDFGQDHMQMKSREYAKNRIFLNRIAHNALVLARPYHSKGSQPISISLLMTRMKLTPDYAVEALSLLLRNKRIDLDKA